jgi:hypothetical protein
MAQRIARAETEGYHGRVGDPIVYSAPPQWADATKALLRLPSYPAEDPRPLAPSGETGEKVYRFAATDQAGLYELDLQMPDGAHRTVRFSRLPQREESNLAQAGEPEVLAALDQPNVRFHAGLAESSGKVADRSPRKAYWWLFLGGVLIVLATENHLGRVFGHHAPATEAAAGRKA